MSKSQKLLKQKVNSFVDITLLLLCMTCMSALSVLFTISFKNVEHIICGSICLYFIEAYYNNKF